MSQVDHAWHEGRIFLVADRRRGLWAAETSMRGKPRIRHAGQLPSTATAHSLLVVGLIASLRTISRAEVEALMSRVDDRVKKPRILVVSNDTTFGEALDEKISGRNRKVLRMGTQFGRELARQVVRFDLTFDTAEVDTVDGRPILTLRRWARSVIPDPKSVNSLFPVAASTVVT
jgi:hypothetical protein